MNSSIETKRQLHIQLEEQDARAIYANLLYLESVDGLAPRTKPLVNILEDFLNGEELYTEDGLMYRKKTPPSVE